MRNAIAALGCFMLMLAPEWVVAEEAPHLKSLAKIADSYGIEVLSADVEYPITTKAGEIGGSNASAKAIETYAPLFAAEFGLYPPSLIKNAKLKRVILCTDLTFAGQRRNAIPDFEHDTLYLDAVRGASNKKYLRKVIHHEFFHIIDLLDDGKLYRDERWAALNPKEHRYGDGGRNSQNLATTSVLTDKIPGFLNHYSTTGVEEDKAEIFANLIVEPELVQKRAETDAVLKAKTAQMRDLLADFCPEMNEDFWKKAQVSAR